MLSLWKKIRSRNSVLVVYKFLRLFFNILTPDDKYSLSKKRVFDATSSNSIIWKSKNMFSILFCISKIYVKFRTLFKKRWASEIICFWNYRLQKAELNKYPKSPVSKHLWIVKMLKGRKDYLNLHCSAFVIFFWSLWNKISSKNSVLVVSKTLTLFFNILTPDDKYSLSVKASA